MSETTEVTARGVTVTVKYGKGYEEPWIVFRGTADEVKADIIATFDMDSRAAGLSLAALTLNAAGLANAMQLTAVQLGAVAITKQEGDEAQASLGQPEDTTPSETPAEDPWAAAEKAKVEEASKPPAAEPEVDPLQVHREAIVGIADVAALKRYWAANQAAFTDADLMASYKARGKELSK